jgi:hypothetical protein
MFLAKLKVTSIALLLACVTGVGMAALTLQAAQRQSHHDDKPLRVPTAGAPKAAAKGGSVGALSNGAAQDAKPAWRQILTMKHDHAITTIACSSDWSAAGDEGGNMFAWDTKTGKNRRSVFKLGKDKTVERLQFTADEKDQFTADGKSLHVIWGGRMGIAIS